MLSETRTLNEFMAHLDTVLILVLMDNALRVLKYLMDNE